MQLFNPNTPSSDFSPSQVIGKWELQRFLGKGGGEEVWLAKSVDPEKKGLRGAIKLLPSNNDEVVRRFRRGEAVLDRVSHHSIPQLLDTGEVDVEGSNLRVHFYVMEYGVGRNLSNDELIGELDLPNCLDILEQVAAALTHMHERQQIHGDVKPSNIVADRNGVAKLIDYGTSRSMDDSKLTRTTSWSVHTPEYASPQVLDKEKPTPKDDLYSFAITVCAVLCDDIPLNNSITERSGFQIEERSTWRAPSKTLRKKWRSEFHAELLDNTVAKALDANPDKRQETVNEFYDDLKRAYDERPVHEPKPIPKLLIVLAAMVVIGIIVVFFLRLNIGNNDNDDVAQIITPTDLPSIYILQTRQASAPTVGVTESTSSSGATATASQQVVLQVQTISEMESATVTLTQISTATDFSTSSPSPSATLTPSITRTMQSTVTSTASSTLSPTIPTLEPDVPFESQTPASLSLEHGQRDTIRLEERGIRANYEVRFLVCEECQQPNGNGWIDLHQVTNRAYNLCVVARRCTLPSSDFDPTGSSADESISLNMQQAERYCQWRGEKQDQYTRLPTQTEWNFAQVEFEDFSSNLSEWMFQEAEDTTDTNTISPIPTSEQREFRCFVPIQP